MNPQEMLDELNGNYKILKAQFQKSDLSQIPPLKLADLMYKHLMAMQKVMKLMGDQQTPPPKASGNSASPTPKASATPSAAAPPVPQSKIRSLSPTSIGDLKSKIPSPVSDPDILDTLRGSSGTSSADLARELGLVPTPRPSRRNLSTAPPSCAESRPDDRWFLP